MQVRFRVLETICLESVTLGMSLNSSKSQFPQLELDKTSPTLLHWCED